MELLLVGYGSGPPPDNTYLAVAILLAFINAELLELRVVLEERVKKRILDQIWKTLVEELNITPNVADMIIKNMDNNWEQIIKEYREIRCLLCGSPRNIEFGLCLLGVANSLKKKIAKNERVTKEEILELVKKKCS